jgi:hypothetical protein
VQLSQLVVVETETVEQYLQYRILITNSRITHFSISCFTKP